MKINAYLVNSFTIKGTGGNPAGVVLNADGLSYQEKLKIAQAVGFSETAFVSQDNVADFAVSFFTVTEEVDFCGHATLATFSTLFKLGEIIPGRYTQRTKAGLLTVDVEANGQVIMEQTLPEYLGVLEYEAIAPLIGINVDQLRSTQLPIEIVSTGLRDIIVPVPFGCLDTLIVDNEGLSAFSQAHDVVGIHAFEMNEEGSAITANCRNFAPLFGIPEESATGSASGALACYLVKHVKRSNVHRFTFEQGRAMDQASLISAWVASLDQTVQKVKVGGFATEIGQQGITLEG
ncbi:PhzF family phenazine biosynthesis protein [Thaumasiovibrio subtropicus]|uniref:PhzF family phenazine biosynthesis protein n=1 Tax=Thaumasiovibrio subtropicus TaxID=1891207 RepID=UPI000B353194|nr:PhzF family phenazine biosynthesis protein [Thaumasiovibrio subtropicus]